MTRVAVLGGTGWVGRHVCAAFARHGYGVVVVARNEVPHTSGYRFHKLDLATASTETIAELLRSEEAEIVVNATESANGTDGSIRTDAEHALINVTMVERLMAAVATLPWRGRVVQLGTIHEYGPVPPGMDIAETQPTNPVNSYARTKLAGSESVLRAARSDTVDGVVLRLVNLSGPHPTPNSFPGKLLGLLRAAGDTGVATVTITNARRDFVDVRDVAEALLIATEKAPSGTVINLGSGAAVEIRELVHLLAAEAGFEPHRLTVQNAHVYSVGGDWIRADITLAAAMLGWRPRISLRESLRDMWLS